MKTLVFLNKNSLAPVGGPLGYVYTLYQEDLKVKHRLDFLDEKTTKIVDNGISSQKIKLKIALREKLYFAKILIYGKRNLIIESNKYDIIHFHSTLDLYKHRRSLKKFHGKVILTSHSPIILSQECYQKAKRWEQILFKPLYCALKQMDYGAFKLADYIVFPCEEAEEPYYHSWPGFAEFKHNNPVKFKYLLTGTFPRKAQIPSAQIRQKLNIPRDAFVVCYVGRHNEIKGYDFLKELGKKILSENENVYFLIAGKEEPLKGLNHERWIEVGWTDDPHSYINAANVFVLPNKETYFDLILLEVLSLGQIVIASRTGGNKYFDNSNYPGILEFGSLDEACNQITEVMNYSKTDIEKLHTANQKAFYDSFNSDVFYDNYIKLLNEITEDQE